MLAIFLMRQPMTIFIKTLAKRRTIGDRAPALIWVSVYAGIALAAFASLWYAGYGRIFWLLLPGMPVFTWHLYLVSRRAERGQRGIEIVGAGVLALAAPASYWVAGAASSALPWLLWGIAWLQSAASIVLVYQRLHERNLDWAGDIPERLRRASRSLGYHSFNLAVSLIAYLFAGLPLLLTVASALMWIDAADTLRKPAMGWKPARIGLRQLIASCLFVLITTAGFLLPR